MFLLAESDPDDNARVKRYGVWETVAFFRPRSLSQARFTSAAHIICTNQWAQ